MTEHDILRVLCETCGAPRGERCRAVQRLTSGMLAMWFTRPEVMAPHRARRARAAVFADKRERDRNERLRWLKLEAAQRGRST